MRRKQRMRSIQRLLSTPAGKKGGMKSPPERRVATRERELGRGRASSPRRWRPTKDYEKYENLPRTESKNIFTKEEGRRGGEWK